MNYFSLSNLFVSEDESAEHDAKLQRLNRMRTPTKSAPISIEEDNEFDSDESSDVKKDMMQVEHNDPCFLSHCTLLAYGRMKSGKRGFPWPFLSPLEQQSQHKITI